MDQYDLATSDGVQRAAFLSHCYFSNLLSRNSLEVFSKANRKLLTRQRVSFSVDKVFPRGEVSGTYFLSYGGEFDRQFGFSVWKRARRRDFEHRRGGLRVMFRSWQVATWREISFACRFVGFRQLRVNFQHDERQFRNEHDILLVYVHS